MKVKLLYDKLSIDGTLFGWNAEKTSRYKLNKSGPQDRQTKRKRGPLGILSVNCRSVINKPAELEGILLSYNPDIVVLTETWLNEEIYDSELIPLGYSAFRKDGGSRDGGVAILVKDNIKFSKMPDLLDVECIFCKAYHENFRYVVAALYRPPNSGVEVLDSLKLSVSEHGKPGGCIILSGDFNLPSIDWETMSLKSDNDSLGEAMLGIAFSFNLLQLVDTYTRVQGNYETILDLFVSGAISSQTKCDVFPGIRITRLCH